MSVFRPFLAIFWPRKMNIFHKTEVQTVILRWSYDTIYQSQSLGITLYVIVKWSPIKYHQNTTYPKLYVETFYQICSAFIQYGEDENFVEGFDESSMKEPPSLYTNAHIQDSYDQHTLSVLRIFVHFLFSWFF